jgi:hypothetical protein
VLLLFVGVVSAVSAFSYQRGSTAAAAVRISSPKDEWLYPLSQPRTLEIPGPLGATTVRIGTGHARVIDSPCPDKLCIQAGELSSPGQWAACLPNRIMVTVVGAKDRTIDAQTF